MPAFICVLVTQLYPTLGDPMNCSPPGSSVHGVLQVRILEWITIFFSRGSPGPGIEPGSPPLQADSLPSEPSAACDLGENKTQLSQYSVIIALRDVIGAQRKGEHLSLGEVGERRDTVSAKIVQKS